MSKYLTIFRDEPYLYDTIEEAQREYQQLKAKMYDIGDTIEMFELVPLRSCTIVTKIEEWDRG